MNSIAEQSRALLPKGLFGDDDRGTLEDLARALMSGRGEASGVAIARQLLIGLKAAPTEERHRFYRFLSEELRPDEAVVAEAARAYLEQPAEATLLRLQKACYPPRLEFFRRLNLAHGATGEIVALRADLLRNIKSDASLASIDRDLERLLTSWFNRGFLVLRRIDWQTPAAILEKIIAYEAVHEIRGWDDLRRRLDPADRRCFAFFHPALVDEPLIFVEVALTRDIPATISEVLDAHLNDDAPPPTTAVFYSISNCQDGLKGVSFGNFLLKQVVEDLVRDTPTLKTFVTLSPVPGFARWLDRTLADENDDSVTLEERRALAPLRKPSWVEDIGKNAEADAELKSAVLALAARYFLVARSSEDRPVDPVARFHLGNGARLERMNWLGDTSERALRDAYGLMVNYRYELSEIERNHEAYAQDGAVAASRAVRAHLRMPAKGKGLAAVPDLLALPGSGKTKRAPSGAQE
ncbi:MCD, Malonyl-CoA decarboxylase MCD [Hyphomicrobium methylovorum]|uniref:malonyl-CoA decarboxylase domain-containing protein n=1 Tax=Hyphomicrobium methylovorum TaxID=84 RepID=UPI0015E66CE2|nr:malonyl-CoA decarboxylase family protein [Hyphomicrobium methylovorum]MBA2127817.1 MCD, Malonyl-CoA decarboxylase MCD [Hyphomicrobium methylovorum]